MKHLSILAVLGLLVACAAPRAYAGQPTVGQLLKIVEKQSQQMDALQKRVQQLETQQAATRQSIIDEIKRTDELAGKVDKVDISAVSKLASWADKVKFSGDMRYRHEFFDVSGKRDRNRQRIRARLQMHANPSDELDLYIRLATGSSPDPASTNQTLTGGFGKKHVWIDRAYFDWHPEVLEGMGLRLLGGKMKNPFQLPWKSDLLWDNDLNPEGLALAYKKALSETLEVFASGGYFWLAENKGGADITMTAGQGGVVVNAAENLKITLGGGYYRYNGIRDDVVLFDPEDSYGNSAFADAAGELHYAEEFHIAEAFAEVATQVGGLPLSVHGHLINNTVADTNADSGWLAGVKLGKAKKPGELEFFYNFRRLEADAAVGLFTDSDFIGGGTDGSGHKFGGALQLTKSMKLGAALFLNDLGLEGDAEDFKRLQVDLKMKF